MGRRVSIVRVYSDPGRESNEYRVLVDRLWPRGRTKDSVDFDEWPKDVTPSSELRTWYAHDRELFEEFSRRYIEELTLAPAAQILKRLRTLSETTELVLLTGTKDIEYSCAEVLRRQIVGAPRTKARAK